MTGKKIGTGTVHQVPADLRKSLLSDSGTLALWNDLTALARNEWICWVTYVKKPETRSCHIERVHSDLKKGKRRPCCWPGCPHRSKQQRKDKIPQEPTQRGSN